MTRRKTQNEFANEAAEVHGVGRYRYGCYHGSREPIEIHCIEHGITFHQTPDNHLHGKIGCEKCEFDKHSRAKAIIYDQEEFISDY